ncbi:MAG: phosphoenolpyruvate synthase [Candidatus Paceibacteria bacterium]
MDSNKNVLWFEEISIDDKEEVGHKNAPLGEMYSELTDKGINVPNGFAITTSAFVRFIESAAIKKDIKDLLLDLDVNDEGQLKKTGKKIRKKIYNSDPPKDLREDIKESFNKLKEETTSELSVAVRSSLAAENLSETELTRYQDSYLNISTEKYLLRAVKKVMASIFSDKSIAYRENQGLEHLNISCSVGVQQMVEAQDSASGVMYTLEPESGFDGVTLIKSSYGYGEYILEDKIDSDQFYVFKDGLKRGKPAIIDKKCGTKEKKLINGKNRDTKQKRVKKKQREQFSINEEDILKLATWGNIVEEHFDQPQEIEWAKGSDGELYLLQARSDTLEPQQQENIIEDYELKHHGKVLLDGTAVGTQIGAGEVKILENPDEEKFNEGDVLVVDETDAQWEPLMAKASAIVTNRGGKTDHTAVVAREMNTPAVVGTGKATKRLKQEGDVTIDCSEGSKGIIYRDLLPFEVHKRDIGSITETATDIMINISNPDYAYELQRHANDGAGLVRTEFILKDEVRIHPLAVLNYEQLEDEGLKEKIEEITKLYDSKEEYYIEQLAQGIAKTAAAFYPKQTNIRLSNFKSDEYRNLIGGDKFEPEENNPMLGHRGARRYYSDTFKPAFKLEAKAIKRAREKFGLDNIDIMVPFCRTPQEGKEVLSTLEECGLESGDDLDIHVLCELPSNVVLADRFARMFDGVSIDSNSLNQFTFGFDEESSTSEGGPEEDNEAAKEMIKDIISSARKYEKPVSVCGQAPSDSLQLVEFLVREGVNSISLNPDALTQTKRRVTEVENTLGNTGDRTNSKLLLLLLALGVISAIVILMGSGCSGQLSKEIKQQDQVTQDFNPAEIRKKAASQARKEQQKKLKQKMLPISVSTFSDFSFEYPFGWKVEQNKDNLMLTDESSDKYISFYTTSTEKSFSEFQSSFSDPDQVKIDHKLGFEISTTSSDSGAHKINKTFILESTSTASGLYEDSTVSKFLIMEGNDQKEYDRVKTTISFD